MHLPALSPCLVRVFVIWIDNASVVQASSSERLRVDIAVVDLHLTEATKKLKGLFPNWMDVTAYTTFLSSYIL